MTTLTPSIRAQNFFVKVIEHLFHSEYGIVRLEQERATGVTAFQARLIAEPKLLYWWAVVHASGQAR